MSRSIIDIKEDIKAKYKEIREEIRCRECLQSGMYEEDHKCVLNIRKLRDEISQLEEEAEELI